MATPAWHEKDAEWKGQMNAVVRELDKNQSELERWLQSIQKKYGELTTDIAVLNTQVNQNLGRWDRILDIATAVVASGIVFFIFHFSFS